MDKKSSKISVFLLGVTIAVLSAQMARFSSDGIFMFLLVSVYYFQVASRILLGSQQNMVMILTTDKFFVKNDLVLFILCATFSLETT